MFGLNEEIRGKHITYRPELDGIRALAIAVVLLHHLGYLNGRGFLGVDVFFTLPALHPHLLRDLRDPHLQ